MLILSRRMSEKIVLPDVQTTLQVVAIRAGAVRLGFEAPIEVRVFREEVWERTGKERVGLGAPRGNGDGHDRPQLRELLDRWQTAAEAGLCLLRQRVGSGPTSDLADIVDALDQELRSLRRQMQECRPGRSCSGNTAP
jgi:carbon storage regulator CsrA